MTTQNDIPTLKALVQSSSSLLDPEKERLVSLLDEGNVDEAMRVLGEYIGDSKKTLEQADAGVAAAQAEVDKDPKAKVLSDQLTEEFAQVDEATGEKVLAAEQELAATIAEADTELSRLREAEKAARVNAVRDQIQAA